MKYFIIAGEPSGDLHGADLVSELKAFDTSAQVIGMGGDKMKTAGMELSVHYSEYSFMGLTEVIKNLRKIKSLLDRIKKEIVRFNPDKVVFIDYGGFNLKVAKFCKNMGFQTHFFILPKVWAWNEKRVHKIRKYVDFGYCIFPFEEDYFRSRGVNAYFVGNPVANQVEKYLKENSLPKKVANQIALLPGSRNQEIDKILPDMLAYARSQPNYSFKIAAHSAKMIQDFPLPPNVELAEESTFQVVLSSVAAVVTSGTANLETALLGTVQVVCYKANSLSYFIGKRLIKIKYISPVNLILDKLVIKELIQNDMNTVNLTTEVDHLLDEAASAKIKDDYKTLKSMLSGKSAAHETAKHIFNSQ